MLTKKKNRVLAAFMAFLLVFLSIDLSTFRFPIKGAPGDPYEIQIVGNLTNEMVAGQTDRFEIRISKVDSTRPDADFDNLEITSSDPAVTTIISRDKDASDPTKGTVTVRMEGAGLAHINVQYVDDPSSANPVVYTKTSVPYQVQFHITNKNTFIQPVILDMETYRPQEVRTTSISQSEDNRIEWLSSRNRVAYIDANNYLQIAGAGTTSITGNLPNGMTDSMENIIVKAAFRRDDATYDAEKDQIIFPYDRSYPLHTNAQVGSYINYRSANEDIIKIDENGNAIGVGAGITNIYIGSLPIVPSGQSFNTQGAGDQIQARVNFEIVSKNTALGVGDQLQLSTNADSYGVSWSINNSSVADINQNGLLTARSAGTVIVTAYLSDTSLFPGEEQVTATLTIQVVDTFKVNLDSYDVDTGDSFELRGIGTADSGTVTWHVENVNERDKDEELVTITPNGEKVTVTAIKKGVEGRVDVWAEYKVNGILYKTDACRVQIHIPVTRVDIIEDRIDVDRNQRGIMVYELYNDISHEAPDNQNVSWWSEDESIAVVDTVSSPGYAYIRGLRGGMTKVFIRSEDGSFLDSIDVYVRQPVTEMILSETYIQTRLDHDYADLTATIIPEKTSEVYDGVDRNIVWSTSDEFIATVGNDVNGTCRVYFHNPGKVTITATPQDKGATRYQKTCTIVIEQPPTAITVSDTNIMIEKGNRRLVTVNVEPENVYIADGMSAYKWVIPEVYKNIIEVDDEGYFVAKSCGTAVAWVESTYDSEVRSAEVTVTVEQRVTEISIPDERTMQTNDYLYLPYTIGPDDATNKAVTWTSSDDEIATVDQNGIVHAHKEGRVMIRITSQDNGVFAECAITVLQPVRAISIPSSKTVKVGMQFTLTATISPGNATNKAVKWTSSDSSVASVQNGRVTARKVGTAIITATAQDTSSGITLSSACLVTVKASVSSVKLNKKSIQINKGQTYSKLKATVKPSNAYDTSVTYISSNSSVVKVLNKSTGVIRGMKGGTATITVMTNEGGKIAICTVKVIEKVSSIKITNATRYINKGSSRKLGKIVREKSATNKKVKWTTSNSNILRVTQSGRVRAVNYGSATITVKAKDGSGKSASVTMRVIRPVRRITLNRKKATVLVGQTLQLDATIHPSNASIKSVKWTSSNKAVATVDFNGVVTGQSPGTCYITATSRDGNRVKATCKLTVKAGVEASEVIINSRTITLIPGQTRTLQARIKPMNSTEYVRWVSGDTSIATVSKDGTVTAVGQGETEVYAISAYSGVETSCTVIVLAMNASSIRLEQYDSYELDVHGATGSIKWYTNDARVATVSNGKVTARRIGRTVIVAKANGKTLRCIVNVIPMREKRP